MIRSTNDYLDSIARDRDRAENTDFVGPGSRTGPFGGQAAMAREGRDAGPEIRAADGRARRPGDSAVVDKRKRRALMGSNERSSTNEEGRFSGNERGEGRVIGPRKCRGFAP
jgi:hypothetical protein